MDIEIDSSTFAKNESSGSGALSLSNSMGVAKDIKLTNNTFYQNKSNKLSPLNSKNGTVFIEGNSGDNIYTNNTFYKNQVERNKFISAIPDVRGVAINSDYGGYSNKLTNNLFVGNPAVGNASNSKKFENVNIGDLNLEESNSLGYDNGNATKDTVAQVYGKYPVSLAENGNKRKAGITKEAVVIPTVMVAPKLSATVGTANLTGGKGTEVDQRGLKRTGKSDIGALEMSSVVYNANGGNFTLAELTKYDGKTYYEGKNPKVYAKVSGPNSSYTMLDGKKVLKPVKENYDFVGWSDVKIAKAPNAKFAAGKKVSVEDQQIVYAVWNKKEFTLKYHSNGKTTGTIPTQKKVATGTSVTIKTQGKMKRKGYKFAGWSTKASSKNGSATYAPGKKLKLVKNTNLYAIWKR